jgi:hypothetical protein
MQLKIISNGVCYMIITKSKYCDGCLERVATKGCLLWHTVLDYVTIRGDDVPTYVNYEDRTTPVRLHYCRKCWDTITAKLPFESEVLPF